MPRNPTLIPSSLPQRPAPPAGLPAASAALWESVVQDHAPNHFRGANLALLETFCRSWALVGQCDRRIAKEGLFKGGKVHPAVTVRAIGWAEMRHCATKLRLSISGTVRADSAAARPDATNAMRKPWQA